MGLEARFFEDYMVGEERSTVGRTITDADVVMHAGQTGDFYPHHMDAVWCATQPFQRRIAHGTLIMSVAVGMTAGDINPHSMSYGYDRIRFIRPVFIGDTITARAEVVECRDHPKKPDLGFVDEVLTVKNQVGDVVLSLVHLYLVAKKPASVGG